MLKVYTDASVDTFGGKHSLVGAIAVVIIRNCSIVKEHSEVIGKASPQQAELRAIETAIHLADTERNLVIYTDCRDAYRAFNGLSSPKSNREQINRIKLLIRRRRSWGRCTQIEYVQGHSGHPYNERAHDLALSTLRKEIKGDNSFEENKARTQIHVSRNKENSSGRTRTHPSGKSKARGKTHKGEFSKVAQARG